MDILGMIDNSTRYVSNNSDFVKINYDKLDEIIDNGNFDNISYWLDSNPFDLLDMDVRDVVNFLLLYHTIGDYCFWGEPKWEIETENGKLDGSFAIMYLLLKRFKRNNDFNMGMLSFSVLLDGNVEIPLLGERYGCLLEMNNYLRLLKTDFYDEVKDFNDDESLFNYIINKFSYFKDECDYKGERIYFYKRAQLLTSDILHVRHILEKVNVDYSKLRGCADYKIPQVMRCLGILEFSDELASIVDKKVEIAYGDSMEVEIRANDLVVIDYIYKRLNGRIARMDINDYIWLLGQDKSKMTKNYHRTKTIYY